MDSTTILGARGLGLWDVVLLLLVAGLCGSLGQAISGVGSGGCLASIALGFIGALVGMWLARLIGLPELLVINIDGTKFPIVWSIMGSAVFVAVINLIARSRR
jgi:uncharacterized membrane protein YeaQ/YmgE (transglycosylase-associated protein family)